MTVLGEYHAALGDLVHRFEGTLERFTGDGLMVFFNDPLPCPDAPRARGAHGGGDARPRRRSSRRAGAAGATTCDFGVGIAQGHATLGRIGFEGRSDYAAIGSVTNLAARLCGEAAPGQILISQRVLRRRPRRSSSPSRSASWRCAGSRGRRAPTTSPGSTRRGHGHEPSSPSPQPRLSELSEDERSDALRAAAGAARRRLGARCGSTSPASRSSSSRRSRPTRRGDTARSCRRSRSACCSCCSCSASRGCR